MNHSHKINDTAVEGPFDISKWLELGLNWDEYLKRCKENIARMKSIYRTVSIPERILESFRQKGPMTIVCISEDWCPDCAQNVPLLVKLAEILPGTSIRLFFRDRNAALVNRYRTAGKRIVPTAVFFDADFNELGRWAGPSRKAKEWTNATLIKDRQVSDIPRKELDEFGPLYDEKFLSEFYLDSLDELSAAVGL
jgi:hypothetical protein